ncbi:ATP-binding protein [Sphingomonas sp. R1]|uniref:ATP-binding protein n=1 Tax=Sphingomonas sp. R1 TaxID=399176 RepID=UPI0022246FFA|nr:ATP-binding protein [Sphingomonas sp. R1]UYY77526.1 ATP-binding protein [Sphingomonas sp. R1]
MTTSPTCAALSYEALFAAAPTPMLVLAPDAPRFTILAANDAYLSATMRTRDDLVGRGVFEAMPDNPSDPVANGSANLRASIERAIASRKPDSMPRQKYDVADRAGRFEARWWDPVNSPVLDDSGTVTAILHRVEDVTATVLADMALRENEARRGRERSWLPTLVEHLPIGVIVVDRDGTPLLCNPAYARIIPECAMPSRLPDARARWFGQDENGQIIEPDMYAGARAPRGDNVPGTEFLHRAPDGCETWVRVSGVPLRDAEGQVAGALCVVVDIDREKQTEARLRELNETLEARVAARTAELEQAHEQLRQSQKLEAMGQLTGGVSHDFNNLLTPIIGSLDLLQRQGGGGERERRLVDRALQAADRAQVLVQRLLAFARRQPLQPVPVDVGALVTNMAELVASTTGPQIEVVVDAKAALPPATADPNQIEMALLNLCVNARDAMPDGGTIRISVSAERVVQHHRSALDPGRYVRLSVADTGIGMDRATLEKAVEPFFSTKGVGRGTGLGLSMVHGLAAQLGGAMTIQSQPGLGTNVEIWLPASDEAAELSGAQAEGTAPRAAGIVLLVDDEDLVRASTADMLGDLGYTVIEAGSAKEALKLLDDGLRPDLLVTDHLMPGKTGPELARDVQLRLPRIRILIISGFAELDAVEADLARLTKPFRQADLARKLDALAGNGEAAEARSG